MVYHSSDVYSVCQRGELGTQIYCIINCLRDDNLKNELEASRKQCMKRQTELRHKLLSADHYQEARQLFFKQHAMLHSVKMAQTEAWSLEDEVFDELSKEKARRITGNSEHSIIWNIWHIARIEDVAMNLLVAGRPQILNQDNWLKQMKVKVRDTGNAMDEEGIADLSNRIDIDPRSTPIHAAAS